MRRCQIGMFHGFRTARLGRAVLLLAAIFAVSGSFGLHPEPANELATSLPAGSAPDWTASVDGTVGADPCTACLAHRFVSLTGPAVFSPAGASTIPLAALPPARLLPLSAPRFIEGRAPPSAG